jgi:hypothetical protein
VWGAVPADVRNVNSRRAVHARLIREAALSGPPDVVSGPQARGCARVTRRDGSISYRIIIESEVNLRTPGQRILRD